MKVPFRETTYYSLPSGSLYYTLPYSAYSEASVAYREHTVRLTTLGPLEASSCAFFTDIAVVPHFRTLWLDRNPPYSQSPKAVIQSQPIGDPASAKKGDFQDSGIKRVDQLPQSSISEDIWVSSALLFRQCRLGGLAAAGPLHP